MCNEILLPLSTLPSSSGVLNFRKMACHGVVFILALLESQIYFLLMKFCLFLPFQVQAITVHATNNYFVTASLDSTWCFYELSSGLCLTQVSFSPSGACVCTQTWTDTQTHCYIVHLELWIACMYLKVDSPLHWLNK